VKIWRPAKIPVSLLMAPKTINQTRREEIPRACQGPLRIGLLIVAALCGRFFFSGRKTRHIKTGPQAVATAYAFSLKFCNRSLVLPEISRGPNAPFLSTHHEKLALIQIFLPSFLFWCAGARNSDA